MAFIRLFDYKTDKQVWVYVGQVIRFGPLIHFGKEYPGETFDTAKVQGYEITDNVIVVCPD